MIWFTADTHFGHKNIIQFCDRPFSDIDEHDEHLIKSWNSKITPTDEVYHLGDFSLCSKDRANEIASRLNGKIFFIRGNHDKAAPVDRFEWVKDYHELKVNKQMFVLSHYAHRVWNKSHYGSFHLFGHSHGDLPDFGTSTDVGVDRWNYAPVSLDEIIAYFEEDK